MRAPVHHKRPEHAPDGDPCSCTRPARHHRTRDRKGRVATPRPYVSKNERTIVAIDGEGQGRDPHLYTYLAAVDEDNTTVGDLFRKEGLRTDEILHWLLSLGTDRLFGYSLGYDLTKWLVDLPDKALYLLNHPELRRRRNRKTGKRDPRPSPIYWRGYKLNYLQRCFTVQPVAWQGKRSVAVGPSVTVWDVFGFYQGKFTKALTDWDIAKGDKLARMVRMKDSRAEHEKEKQSDIQEYCREECFYLSKLVRALIETTESCGYPLVAFRGAGSIAAAILRKHSVKQYMAPPPVMALEAVGAAFFGGRFERNWIGPVPGPVHNRDIASAYPYHISRLPCLVHGRWEHFTRDRSTHARIESATLALVHATVHPTKSGPKSYGPFPFRSAKGTITFPLALGGTWVWKDEYLAGRRLWPGVDCTEAWIYRTECDCRPFGMLPDIYRERLRIGKEARGIVLKLGPNSIYGKLAQSVGSPPYQSWTWAGNITSNTRAQLLTALAMANDPADVRMMATDGIFSISQQPMPHPVDTGTGDCRNSKGELVPLGSWESKVMKRGIFILQPGIYFPLDPTEEEQKEIKARGMARDVLLKNAARIQEYWELYQRGATIRCEEKGCQSSDVHFHIKGLQRFVGMKSGVLQGTAKTGGPHREHPPDGGPDEKCYCGRKGKDHGPVYGEWVEHPIEISFDPEPKRPGKAHGWDGGAELKAWEYAAGESTPYKKTRVSPEGKALKLLELIMGEQPGGDFCYA